MALDPWGAKGWADMGVETVKIISDEDDPEYRQLQRIFQRYSRPVRDALCRIARLRTVMNLQSGIVVENLCTYLYDRGFKIDTPLTALTALAEAVDFREAPAFSNDADPESRTWMNVYNAYNSLKSYCEDVHVPFEQTLAALAHVGAWLIPADEGAET
jgi:hypothetical protein